jgi:hypothetical protein
MRFSSSDFAYFLSIIRDRIAPDVGGQSTLPPLKNLGFSASVDIRRRPASARRLPPMPDVSVLAAGAIRVRDAARNPVAVDDCLSRYIGTPHQK